jgi:hypothetical protein
LQYFALFAHRLLLCFTYPKGWPTPHSSLTLVVVLSVLPKVTEADLDAVVARVLQQKFAAGLFDSGPIDPAGASILDSAPHRQLALEAATQGMTFLLFTILMSHLKNSSLNNCFVLSLLLCFLCLFFVQFDKRPHNAMVTPLSFDMPPPPPTHTHTYAQLFLFTVQLYLHLSTGPPNR